MWLPLLCVVAFAANHAPPYDNTWCWELRPCVDNGGCKQPNGVNGACCLGVCRSHKLSRGELCGSSLPAGCPSCDNNLACVDVPLNQKRCQQQDASTGCSCTNSTSGNCISTQPCLPSGLCGPKDVAPNGRCEVSSQCFPNSVCNGTHCQYVPDGQGCGTPDVLSNLCLPGSICDTGSKCSVIAVLNGACNADFECQAHLWCSNKKCANRTALGGNCTGTACVAGSLCNSGTCVTPRSVAHDAACTQADACISGFCAGSKCTPTHFVSAGQACNADLDCPFGASCQTKICTPSGLGMACDPTLGGADMDKQCQGSNDLYCACSGLCLATDAAVTPQGTSTSDCQAAKDVLSKYKISDLKKVDTNSLTAEQRMAIATDQCCRNCNKDDRVSQIGAQINCVSKSISQAPATCNLLGVDALALTGCPTRTTSDAALLKPVLGMFSIVLCMLL